MNASLTAHLLQSTVFAAAAGLLTLAFRRNRAQVRYWLWLSASLKFVVPFALLMSLGSYLETRMPAAHQIATQIATPEVSYTLEQFTSPSFKVTAPMTTTTPAATQWIALTLFVIWLCGFLTLAAGRFRSWLRVRKAVRTSTPVDVGTSVEVRSSPAMLEPGVVGILHPIVLLPEGITERLSSPELSAVLAHELCHVRRRDNLFAALHMAVETVFWFHPLIWWMGARLVEERERTCDEEVLSQGNQPDVYADAILNVCKLYTESPLACVSGVSGAGIRRRIEAIMLNRRLPELNRAKQFLLAGAGAAALTGPIVVGLLISVGNVPEIRAQAAASRTTKPQTAAPRAKFEAASIRPCDSSAAARGGRGSTRGEGGGVGSAWTPGRVTRTCVTTMTLIQDAFVRFADGKTEPTFAMRMPPVNGAPSWVNSDLYTLEAKAEVNANRPTMMGPMLQSLLQDRFGLKLHYETRTVPSWDMTVAKGGSKLRPSVTESGKCEIVLPPGMSPKGPDGMNLPGFSSDGHLKVPPPPPGQPCHFLLTLMHGRNEFLVGKAIGLDELSSYLVRTTDRPIFDKTGLTGKFDVVLEFAPDQIIAASSGESSSDVPGLVTAIEQDLGLKLVSSRGPRDFMVIDHIDRPSAN